MFRINVIGVPMKDGKFRPSSNVGMADIHMSVMTEGINIGVWLEVKQKGKYQSKTQKEFEKRVKEQNGWYFIVRSIEDVQEVVDCVSAPDLHHQVRYKTDLLHLSYSFHLTALLP